MAVVYCRRSIIAATADATQWEGVCLISMNHKGSFSRIVFVVIDIVI